MEAQKTALEGVLVRLRSLNLPGWFEPEVIQSSTWPYRAASWSVEDMTLLVEFEWKALEFKYGLHPKNLHGFTYYSPADLSGPKGREFLLWFRRSWTGHIHTEDAQ